MESLRKEFDRPRAFYGKLFAKQWAVYAKRPFAGPDHVVEYSGRYTHKIAISNHRIRSLDNGRVGFTAKDYRKSGARYTLSLSDAEFKAFLACTFCPRVLCAYATIVFGSSLIRH